MEAKGNIKQNVEMISGRQVKVMYEITNDGESLLKEIVQEKFDEKVKSAFNEFANFVSYDELPPDVKKKLKKVIDILKDLKER